MQWNVYFRNICRRGPYGRGKISGCRQQLLTAVDPRSEEDKDISGGGGSGLWPGEYIVRDPFEDVVIRVRVDIDVGTFVVVCVGLGVVKDKFRTVG